MSARSLPFKLPAVLLRTGECFVPTQISWRRAEILRARGWADLYPFHERWLGRLMLTTLGQEALCPDQGGEAR